MASTAKSTGKGEKSGKTADRGEKSAEKVEMGAGRGDKCGRCGLMVKDQDLGLQCELCEGWWHANCEGISEEGFKVLQLDNTHWYCLACNNSVGKILAAVNKLQMKHDKMENE